MAVPQGSRVRVGCSHSLHVSRQQLNLFENLASCVAARIPALNASDAEIRCISQFLRRNDNISIHRKVL